MATLQKIRSKGPLLVGVIALALFAFIAGDAFRVFQPSQPHDVGEVNGTSLPISEYDRLIDEYSNIQKAFSGRNSLTEMETNQIKDMVWSTFVDNQLIADEAAKLGLTVTDAELNYVLDQGVNPSFRLVPMFVDEQTGRFDKDRLFMFLSEYDKLSRTKGMDPAYLGNMQQIHSMWAFVEKSILQERLSQKYMNLISSGITTNKIEAELAFNGRVNQANVVAAVVPFSSVEDSKVEVSESDLQKEYDAKKEMFKQNVETRAIDYIDVKISPSAADVEALEKEVAEATEELRAATDNYGAIVNNSASSNIAYNDVFLSLNLYPQDVIARVKTATVGETVGPYTNAADATINAIKVVAVKNLPDSVQFRMLQLQGLEPEVLAKSTDSIVNVLSTGGSFTAVADELQQPAEAFWISEATISSPDQFSLYNTLGDMSLNEVKTIPVPSGNLILQLVDRKHYVDKYKLAVVKRDMEISSETASVAYNKFSEFVAKNGTIDELKANAEEAGYHVIPQELSTQDYSVGNIPATKDALRWAFSNKPGTVSNIFECGEGDHLLVVAVKNIVPAGYRPLAVVKEDLRRTVINNKKADYIVGQIEAINPTSIADFSKIQNAVVDTIKHVSFNSPAFLAQTNMNEPVISGYASVAKEGAISKPVKGNSAVMVLDVVERDKTEEEFNEQVAARSVASELSYFANSRSILYDLMQKAKIVDVRYLYF